MPRGAKKDPLGTAARCYLDPRSFVTRSGEEFLYGEDTSVRRHMVWERCDGFCERTGCNRNISEETMHMHHVKHRSKGGSDCMNNLQALCGRCHKFFHKDRAPQWSGSKAAD